MTLTHQELLERINAHKPEGGFLENSMGFLLAKCLQRVHAMARPTLDQFGMTPQQLMVLFALVERDGQSQSELGERAAMDRTTTMRIIDRLEARKLVERQRDARDRRAYRVHITDAGLEQVNAILPHLKDIRSDFLSPLGEEEQLKLVSHLQVLRGTNGVSELAS